MANTAGALHHIAVLRDTLTRADAAATAIRRAGTGSEEVQVSGIAPSAQLNGWLFFGEEIIERAQRNLPGARISLSGSAPLSASPGVARLRWDEAAGEIVRAP